MFRTRSHRPSTGKCTPTGKVAVLGFAFALVLLAIEVVRIWQMENTEDLQRLIRNERMERERHENTKDEIQAENERLIREKQGLRNEIAMERRSCERALSAAEKEKEEIKKELKRLKVIKGNLEAAFEQERVKAHLVDAQHKERELHYKEHKQARGDECEKEIQQLTADLNTCQAEVIQGRENNKKLEDMHEAMKHHLQEKKQWALKEDRLNEQIKGLKDMLGSQSSETNRKSNEMLLRYNEGILHDDVSTTAEAMREHSWRKSEKAEENEEEVRRPNVRDSGNSLNDNTEDGETGTYESKLEKARQRREQRPQMTASTRQRQASVIDEDEEQYEGERVTASLDRLSSVEGRYHAEQRGEMITHTSTNMATQPTARSSSDQHYTTQHEAQGNKEDIDTNPIRDEDEPLKTENLVDPLLLVEMKVREKEWERQRKEELPLKRNNKPSTAGSSSNK